MGPSAMHIAIQEMPTPLRLDAEGVVRVGPEGVALDTVVEAFNRGEGAEEVAEANPSLGLADVYSAFAYYVRYRTTVDAYLQGRKH